MLNCSLETLPKLRSAVQLNLVHHSSEAVIENDQVKLLWDFKIQTNHHLDHNRPDIVVLEKASSLVPNHGRGMPF